MTRRPRRRSVDHSSALVDLDVVFADDELIDAIAAGPWGAHQRSTTCPPESRSNPAAVGALLTVDPLTELFENWRDELAAVPIPAPPAARRAADAVENGKAPRKRSLRPALAIAAAIAVLLAGSATVGSKDATPDSALWRITQVMWPDRVQSVASRAKVGVAIEEAQTALQAGHPQDAQLALLRATVELGNVDDIDGRAGMQEKVNDLWVVAAPDLAESTRRADGQSDAKIPEVRPQSASPAPPADVLTPVLAAAAQAPAQAITTDPAVAAGPAGPSAAAQIPPAPAGSSAGNGNGSDAPRPVAPLPDAPVVTAAPAVPADPPPAPVVEQPSPDPSVPASSAPSTVPPPEPIEPIVEPTSSAPAAVASTQQAPAPTPPATGTDNTEPNQPTTDPATTGNGSTAFDGPATADAPAAVDAQSSSQADSVQSVQVG